MLGGPKDCYCCVLFGFGHMRRMEAEKQVKDRELPAMPFELARLNRMEI